MPEISLKTEWVNMKKDQGIWLHYFLNMPETTFNIKLVKLEKTQWYLHCFRNMPEISFSIKLVKMKEAVFYDVFCMSDEKNKY